MYTRRIKLAILRCEYKRNSQPPSLYCVKFRGHVHLYMNLYFEGGNVSYKEVFFKNVSGILCYSTIERNI